MRKILIIKTGSTIPRLKSTIGDFEDWIAEGMGLRKDEGSNWEAQENPAFPALEEVAGVAITGSHAMVTDKEEWSERLVPWLQDAVKKEIPLLGICYGHQLLAHALGGEVANNPNGREYGTGEIFLKDAKEDPLFQGLPSSFFAHLSHTQSVTALPSGATLLGSSSMDPHQAFRVGDVAWGVQFHPEFNRGIMEEYLRENWKVLEDEGRNPEELLSSCKETPVAFEVLWRFGKVVEERWGVKGIKN